VIEFCWLDSTVSTAELLDDDFPFPDFELLLLLLLLLLPPQPATRAATQTSAAAATQLRWLIHRFIEDHLPLC
jgi:hypothetical protein